MTRPLTILSIVGLFGCQGTDPSDTTVDQATEIVTTGLDTADKEVRTLASEPLTCTCPTKALRPSHSYDFAFSKHDPSGRDQEGFNKWSNDTLRREVTSIRFSHLDTIPEQFGIFENVEQVIIANVFGGDFREIHGLDMFPKLRSIVFWGSSVSLAPTSRWMKKIERLHAEKTSIHGVDDFASIPNLRELYMAYSGFGDFPKNIEALKCLSKLTMGAYRFGSIDLTGIDLTRLPCLKELEIQTWYDTLTGIPQGLENSNLRTVRIHHQKLTEAEKEKIKLARR